MQPVRVHSSGMRRGDRGKEDEEEAARVGWRSERERREGEVYSKLGKAFVGGEVELNIHLERTAEAFLLLSPRPSSPDESPEASRHQYREGGLC